MSSLISNHVARFCLDVTRLSCRKKEQHPLELPELWDKHEIIQTLNTWRPEPINPGRLDGRSGVGKLRVSVGKQTGFLSQVVEYSEECVGWGESKHATGYVMCVAHFCEEWIMTTVYFVSFDFVCAWFMLLFSRVYFVPHKGQCWYIQIIFTI